MTLLISRRDLLLLVLAAACWASGTVVSKRAVEEFPPLLLLPVQLAVSVTALAVLMRGSGLSLTGSPAPLSRLGILNPGIGYALGLVGLTYISASLSVVLWALEPLLILLLAGVYLHEGISVRLVVLSLIAAAGTSLVASDPTGSVQLLGVVVTIGGVACCAAYSVLARRWVAASDSTAQVVLAQQAYALAFATAAALISTLAGGLARPVGASAIGVGSAVASGLLYYAAAYWCYLGALRRTPASVAATSFYLIPLFGITISFVALGDRFSVPQWLGAAIVLVAVASVMFSDFVRRSVN